MADLVALDLPGGPAWVEHLLAVWEAGDAALPVDHRLPPPARAALLDALRPARVAGPEDAPGAGTPRDRAVPVLDGDALVVATSGTTGSPRGVILTQEGIRAHARAVHERLDVDRVADRWLACLPLAHVGGLGVVVRALVDGVGVEVRPGFDAGEVVSAARDRGATLTSLVPTAVDRLGPEVARFRTVLVGGQADPSTRPANVVRTYGLTESGGGVVYDGVPLRGVEVRVGAGGQVALRGPSLLRAYRSADPEGTDPKDDQGWLATGDLGGWDDAGRLVVHGRAGDLIVSGGENVWPDPVEDALRAHPALADVAVGGRPDPEWGQRVVAFVVVQPGSAAPALAELREHVKATLPAWCAPQELVLVEQIPRTALGKVQRAALPRA